MCYPFYIECTTFRARVANNIILTLCCCGSYSMATLATERGTITMKSNWVLTTNSLIWLVVAVDVTVALPRSVDAHPRVTLELSLLTVRPRTCSEKYKCVQRHECAGPCGRGCLNNMTSNGGSRNSQTGAPTPKAGVLTCYFCQFSANTWKRQRF